MKRTCESNLHHTPIFLLLVLFFHVISASQSDPASPPYRSDEVILLSCGEHSKTEDDSGRVWKGDVGSRFLPSQESTTSTANSQISVPQVPYMTAHVFMSEATYVFPVTDGRKFVRLYFYPANYNLFVAHDAIFTVRSGPYNLLRNFSSYITSRAQNFDYLIYEFSIYATNGFLNLTFTPSADVPNAYAFVNGIEIVSMPNIFSRPARAVLDDHLPPQTYQVLNESALQTVVRLNVGGRDISPVEDSGLFRAWSDDSSYIFGAAVGVTSESKLGKTIEYTADVPYHIAPREVYETARSMGPDPYINKNYNLTWIFPVDAGFSYLVRLHFCEIQPLIYKENQRVFKIFLHNQTAEVEADVIAWGNGKNGVPVYRDYLVLVGNDPSSSPELWVDLHPNTATGSQYFDATLNGIEIFKLSDYGGNLGGPNPVLPPDNSAYTGLVGRALQPENSKNGKLVAVLVGAVAVVSLTYVAFIAFSRWPSNLDSRMMLPSSWSNQGKQKRERPFVDYKRGRPFSFAEKKMASEDYDAAAHEDLEEQSRSVVFPYKMEVQGR